MTRTRMFSALALGAAVVSSGAIAANKEAILSQVTSPVMVNQGETYVEAQEGMLLYPGDQLMVMNGGSAQINYANGCVSEMMSNEMVRVGSAEAMCNTAASAGTNQQIGASGSGSGGSGSGGMSGLDMAGLAAIIATTGYVAYEAFDDDDNDNNNISP